MENSIKNNIREMKVTIKSLVAQQKEYKKITRKPHTSSTWEAQSKEFFNTKLLREYYIAYAMLRGKTINDVEPKRKTEPNWDSIYSILKKYGYIPAQDNTAV